MQRLDQTTRKQLTFGIVLLIVVLGILSWLRGTTSPATPDEIRAVIPAEFLAEPVIDKSARARFDSLLTVVQLVEFREFYRYWQMSGGISGPLKIDGKPEPPIDFEASATYWRSNAQLLTRFETILASGAFQLPETEIAPEDAVKIRTIARSMSGAAIKFGNVNDYAKCTRLLTLCINLGNHIIAGKGPIQSYLVGEEIQSITMNAIATMVAESTVPNDDLKKIELAMKANQPADEDLCASFVTQYRSYLLQYLRNPIEKQSILDPLETTRAVGKELSILTKNARHPYSECEYSGSQLATRLQSEFDSATGIWPDGGYTGPQLIGTLQPILVDERWIYISCNRRARREATRVLLASRIYRSTHGGQLPATTEGFVPILGAWPKDPFNGKPLIYNPKTELVYSVGPNLKDDNGDIYPREALKKDIGLSLH